MSTTIVSKVLQSRDTKANSLLIPVIQIPIHKELHIFLQCQLIGPHRPEHLRLLTRVEAIDVDESILTTSESFAKIVLVGEGAFHELDIAEIEEAAGSRGFEISGQDSGCVSFVGDEALDDRSPLCAGAADYEDFG